MLKYSLILLCLVICIITIEGKTLEFDMTKPDAYKRFRNSLRTNMTANNEPPRAGDIPSFGDYKNAIVVGDPSPNIDSGAYEFQKKFQDCLPQTPLPNISGVRVKQSVQWLNQYIKLAKHKCYKPWERYELDKCKSKKTTSTTECPALFKENKGKWKIQYNTH